MWQANCGAWMNLVPRHGPLPLPFTLWSNHKAAVGAPLAPSALCRGPDASGGVVG